LEEEHYSRTIKMLEIISQLQPIIYSILGAIVFYATSGYIKQDGPFSAKKFIGTATIGAAIGVVSYFANLKFDAAFQMLLATGATVAIEQWVKAIYRKLEKLFSHEKSA